MYVCVCVRACVRVCVCVCAYCMGKLLGPRQVCTYVQFQQSLLNFHKQIMEIDDEYDQIQDQLCAESFQVS